MARKIKVSKYNWRRVVKTHNNKKIRNRCVVCGKPIPRGRVCCNQCYDTLYA